jgi:hypothetical protein
MTQRIIGRQIEEQLKASKVRRLEVVCHVDQSVD